MQDEFYNLQTCLRLRGLALHPIYPRLGFELLAEDLLSVRHDCGRLNTCLAEFTNAPPARIEDVRVGIGDGFQQLNDIESVNSGSNKARRNMGTYLFLF